MEEDVLSNLSSDMNLRSNFDITSDVKTELQFDLKTDLQAGGLNILALLGIALNGFVFLMYYSRRAIKSSSNRFVLSLAASHILQCIVIIPLYIVSFKKWISGETWCKVTESLTVCVNLASVLSVLLIAIDRNRAVNAPLHYNLNPSKLRTGILIAITWVSSIIFATPILFGIPELDCNNCDIKPSASETLNIVGLVYSSILTVLGFVVPLISVTCLYFAMFRAAENSNAKARRNSSNSSSYNEVVVDIKSPKNFGENEYSLRRNFSSSSDDREPKRNYFCILDKHKAAVTGLLVVVSFILCWSPFFIIKVYQQFYEVTNQIKFSVNFLSFFSCILNPYVYFYRNRSTWKIAKKLVSRLLGRNKEFTVNPATKKKRIDISSCVFRLPTSFSQTVLASQVPIEKSISSDSKDDDNTHNQFMVAEVTLELNKIDVFSVEVRKQLIHQDSTSSHYSSDAFVPTVRSEADLPIRYQTIQQRLSVDTASDTISDDFVAKL